jgi:filamentous hemagglutinin family protein
MSNRDRHLFSISILHLLFLTLSSLLIEKVNPVYAQINADDTLGAENSVVNRDVLIKGIRSDRIDGGARRGANLFHSFRQFIIPEGRGAYFSNPDGVRSIFSRVTGGNGSQILGTLGVLGNANLFLIDPKGVIFGANATLDISGSFITSTANSIAFPNGENFSASNPNAAPLLTIDVPVPVGLIFESDNSGVIFNAADLKTRQNLALVGGTIVNSGTLSTPGKDIALVTVPAGTISTVRLDGTGKFIEKISNSSISLINGEIEPTAISFLPKPGDIFFLGGQIDASSNGIAGNVILNSAGDTLLANGATVNVRGAGGGSIAVNARDLGMTGGSQLLAGIGSGLGSPQAQAGNVNLNVADEIVLGQSSGIENRVNQNAIGNAGDINVRAGSLTLSEGAFLSASTLGRGNGGDIRVIADGDVRLDGVGGTGNNRSRSRISSVIGESAVGEGGNIAIAAQSLSVTNGALINTEIFEATNGTPGGRGNAGDIFVTTKDNVTISGSDRNDSISRISSTVGASTIGNGGDIVINTGALSLSNNARLITLTAAQGNTGDIVINTGALSLSNDALLTTLTAAQGNAGGIFVEARSLSLSNRVLLSTITTGTGKAGNVQINVPTISITNSAGLSSETFGKGRSGNLTINTSQLLVKDGAFIGTTAERGSQGNAGNLTINASELVQLSGTSTNNQSSSRLTSSTLGQGNAGDLSITTQRLLIQNGAGIAAGSQGEGDGGNVTLNASELVQLSGNLTNNRFSAITTLSTGKGDAGDLEIDTGDLLVRDGASISTTTLGEGKGGNTLINANRSVQVIGSSANDTFTGMLTGTGGKGNAGNLEINTEQLLVRERAGILTNTVGEGQGGSLLVNTRQLLVEDGANIETTAEQGSQGNAGTLTIDATESIQLIGTSADGQSPSRLTTRTLGKGKAGDLSLTTRQLSVRDGAVIATTAESGSQGNSGNLTINASELVQLSGTSTNNQSLSRLTSSTFGQGDAGNLSITTQRLLVQNGAGIAAVSQGSGDAGDLKINTGEILVRDRALISTTTLAEGKGGNLSINASDSVSLDRLGLIFSGVGDEGKNNAGNINIRARSLSVTNNSLLLSNTAGKGDAGDIAIDVDKTVTVSGLIIQRLTGNDFAFPGVIGSSVETGGEGQAGNIDIKAESLLLNNAGFLVSSTSGRGNAGNISLKVDNFVRLNNSSGIGSSIERGGVGIGGNINIQARSLTLKDGSTIQAGLRAANEESPGGIGQGGNISINTSDFVEIAGTSLRPFSVFLAINPNNPGEPVAIEPPNLSSGLFTSTQTGARGLAGNIFITTGEFRLADGAVVEAQTANIGRAGNITIDANTIDVTGGAQIISATRGSGNAGDIRLRVKDSLTLSGSDPNFERRLAGVGGDRDRITNISPESGLFANTDEGSTGDGGNIFIEGDPNTVTIDDGAIVTVNSQGQGRGGQIDVKTGSLTLDNGTLSAQIESNQTGEALGNIILDVQNLLLLRNGSQISTTVGTPGAGGDGGNIFINAGSIVAIPNENSDITANAFEGTGGNISISTDSIFGINFRENLTPLSDITASSNAGFTGSVIIDTSGIDPTRGLENLPQDNINVQVAQGCQIGASGESNISFYNLGRGGVPPSPEDLLNIPFTGEWQPLELEESNIERNPVMRKQKRDRVSPILSCGK